MRYVCANDAKRTDCYYDLLSSSLFSLSLVSFPERRFSHTHDHVDDSHFVFIVLSFFLCAAQYSYEEECFSFFFQNFSSVEDDIFWIDWFSIRGGRVVDVISNRLLAAIFKS